MTRDKEGKTTARRPRLVGSSPDTANLRKDLTPVNDDPSHGELLALGARVIPQFDDSVGDDWNVVAKFYHLYPGGVDYVIGFPSPTETDPGSLHIIVAGRSPFGHLNKTTNTVESQWMRGAYVFDGVHGMPDDDSFDGVMAQAMLVVGREVLNGWRP